MGLLIDSTVFIHAERSARTPAELIELLLRRFSDPRLALSVMTAGELFHGAWRASSPAQRARREEFIESVISVVPCVPITLAVARVFGEVDAQLRSAGERVPTSDLLIASTALVRGDAVVTGNRRHFERVPGLQIHELE